MRAAADRVSRWLHPRQWGLVALFLALYELAAENSFYLLECSLAAALLGWGWEILRQSKGNISVSIHKVCAAEGQRLVWVWRAAGGYLMWEGVTLLTSPLAGEWWGKGRTVALGLLLSLLLLHRWKVGAVSEQSLLRVICLAGIAVAAVAWLNRIFPIYPQVYGRRLSLRLDYNLFAQVLLLGLAAGEVLWHTNARCRSTLWLGLAPSVLLSSSRRGAVYLMALWAAAAGLLLTERLRQQKGKTGKAVLCWLAEQLTLLLCVLLLTLLGQWALSLRFEQLAPEQRQQVTSSAAALERYQPVEGGESKRKLLWELAIRQYRGYSAAEKLFGRGFGADALLYRISDDPRLLQAYPPQSRERLSAHNFLLTDLLNGGLVQMVLGASVWLLLAVYLIREYLPTLLHSGSLWLGLFLGFGFGMVLLNSLMSCRFGFLYDRTFWVLLCCLERQEVS